MSDNGEELTSANPYLLESEIKMRRARKGGYTRTTELMDTETGEVIAHKAIITFEDRDEEQFVKVFAQGIAASEGMNKAGERVFRAVLKAYQDTRMSGAFVEFVHLEWFDDGLNGQKLDMSERTFRRGFKELLDRDFFRPRSRSTYWVNPQYFFKGNRIAMVKAYQLVRSDQPDPATIARDVTPDGEMVALPLDKFTGTIDGKPLEKKNTMNVNVTTSNLTPNTVLHVTETDES